MSNAPQHSDLTRVSSTPYQGMSRSIEGAWQWTSAPVTGVVSVDSTGTWSIDTYVPGSSVACQHDHQAGYASADEAMADLIHAIETTVR